MYKIKKLASGLEIISAPAPGTKTITALVMVATGSRFESKTVSGLSHFLEHLMFKGTKKRPTTLAISSELDRAGGEYNAFTGKEYTGYYIKVAAGQIRLALDVLSDMMFNSNFAAKEIEREKGVVIEELNMYQDNPLYYIEDLFERCLYGETPAGRDTLGSKETIANFSRRAVLSYAGSQYSADKAIVCLAGAVSPAAIESVEKYFSGWRKKNYRDQPPTREAQQRPAEMFHFKKTDQAHLSLGVRALPYAHPDEPAVKLAAIILGGTMSSRLFTELRERRGLAYYVRTHTETYTDSGYLTTQAGVPVDKLEQAVKIILNEYGRLAEKPMGREELDKVKQSLIGRAAIELESSDAVASWYGRQAILLKEQKRGGKILTPEAYYGKIKKISAPDIRRVAREIFVSGKLNLAVIGPYERREKLGKILKL